MTEVVLVNESPAEILASYMDGERPIFELIGADTGHVWRIYADGRVEGFPENVVVMNWLAPVLDALQSET